jgi:hypothetical protein
LDDSSLKLIRKKERRRARSSRLPVIPLSGNPTSLTEGG